MTDCLHHGSTASVCAVRWAALAACCSLVLGLAACEKEPAKPASAAAKPPTSRLELSTRIIEYKNRLQKDPYSADARYALGRAFLEQANPRAAEVELSKALELGMDPNLILPVLARTWILMGRSRDLIAAHADTKLTNPTAAAELKAAVGLAYANTGDASRARAMADAALMDDPKAARARVLQAQIALSDRRVDDALRSIDETLTAHPESIEAWDLKGDILLMVKSDATGAKAAYEQALTIDARNVPIHAKLMAMALGSNDLVGAQARLDKLTEAAPGSLPHRYFQARLHYAKGNLKAAQEELKVTLTEYPKDLRSLILSAEVDLRAGSLRTAMESLSVAFTFGPTVVRTRHLLAEAYLRSGTPEKAQMILEPLVRPGSNDAAALGLAAEAALQSDLTFVATRLFERAAVADPGNARYRAVLAMARISKGDFEGGFSELESAAATDPTTYSDMALLSASLQVGDLAAATRAAERVATKQPKRPSPHWALGQLKLRAKSPDEARQHFERAIALDAAFVPAAVALAALDLEAQDAPKARARFQGVLALNPTNLDALLALAEIQFRTGDSSKKVTAALDNVVELHRGKPRPWLALINHLIRIDDRPGALLAAQKASGDLPDDVSIIDALGRAQMTAGESAQALNTFRRIVTLRPKAYEPRLRMADVYAARNELDSAIETLREVIRLKPSLISLQVKLTELLVAKKDWRDALRVARDVQYKFPKDPKGLHLEGLVYAAQKQWPTAVTAFRNAMKVGESSELTLQLHTALQASGKTDEASRLASQWLAKHPKDNYFIGYLGEVALLTKDFATAEGHFRAILQTDPRNVDAMNNLAWLLTAQSKPGAVDFARKALELQPGRVEVMDTLSMALASESQLPAALANQKRAVDQAPNAPALRLNLARLAVKSKDYALARTELDRLSSLGKAFPAQADVWQLRQQLP